MTVTLGSDTARGQVFNAVSQREDTYDDRRREQIEEYRVLGRAPAADLVSLAELAAQICDTSVAAISLVTDTEVHHVATTGFEPTANAREDDPFVNRDENELGFYADSRLVSSTGLPVGMLFVADSQPRTLTARQRGALAVLADRVMDVLELRLRTRELEASLEAMQQSNEQLAVFAGQVSHDLRTPLTGVLGYAKMLADRPTVAQDEQSEWLLRRAIASGERMSALIEELLDYARVGGGLGCKDVDLHCLAHEVVADLGPQLSEAEAEVHVENMPTVCGDEAQLRALLQNLVANSAKFTRPGTAPRISITGQTFDDHWRVEVTDNGTGVPEKQRRTVFDLLVRGGHDSVEGSGIGLATCRRIVDAHGGEIGLGSVADGGTVVWFELPNRGHRTGRRPQ